MNTFIGKYKLYLFDFDYTLANSEKGILMCFQNTLVNNGYLNVDDEKIKREIGKTLPDMFQIITGVNDKEILEQYKVQYKKMAACVMCDNTVLFPYVEEMLKALKAKGATVAIVSTKTRVLIESTIEKYKLNNVIDFIIGPEEVKEPKPDPEGVFIAIKKAGVKPNEVLYAGDSLVDAKTAQNANVDFVAVLNGATKREEFSTYPHVGIVNNLSEF